ncbi:hypothetical protein HK105_206063 [Polyrhizophydium stewartii]|uniref:Ankyrin repeat protein n=1 Tax=Polyrhizophydium stewartii TaxID=2732419 RepID=A0ABR4N4M7_9FUNG
MPRSRHDAAAAADRRRQRSRRGRQGADLGDDAGISDALGALAVDEQPQQPTPQPQGRGQRKAEKLHQQRKQLKQRSRRNNTMTGRFASARNLLDAIALLPAELSDHIYKHVGLATRMLHNRTPSPEGATTAMLLWAACLSGDMVDRLPRLPWQVDLENTWYSIFVRSERMAQALCTLARARKQQVLCWSLDNGSDASHLVTGLNVARYIRDPYHEMYHFIADGVYNTLKNKALTLLVLEHLRQYPPHEHPGVADPHDLLLMVAAGVGDLGVVKRIVGAGGVPSCNLFSACRFAILRRFPAVVDAILSSPALHDMSFISMIEYPLSRAGDLEMLQIAAKRLGRVFQLNLRELIQANGNDCAIWAINNGYVGDTSFHQEWCICQGNVEMFLFLIKYVHDNMPEIVWTAEVMEHAASGGQLSALEFCARNRTEGCSDMALVWAASQGHVDAVRFLLHQFPGRAWSSEALERACLEGKAKSVQVLLEHGMRATQAAWQWAASEGQVHVIDMLIQHKQGTGMDLEAARQVAIAAHKPAAARRLGILIGKSE